jgi:hypothetical protein
MKIFCIVALLLLNASSASSKTSNRQLLLSMHKELDAMCRGGYGNRPSTDEACRVRDSVSIILSNQRAGVRKSQSNEDLALSIYKDLDAMCRGGYGDRPETQQACDVRNKATALLRNMGYCWRSAWWKKCRA